MIKIKEKKQSKKENSEKKENEIRKEKKNNCDGIKLKKKDVKIILTSVIAIILIISGIYFSYKIIYPSFFKKVEIGDEVEVWYTGKLEDGTVFDTNRKEIAESLNMSKQEYNTLKFIAGKGQLIKGFDKAVLGMKVGEKKEIKIPPSEAYGSYIAELVRTFSMEEFKETFPSIPEPIQGMKLFYRTPQGKTGTFIIKNVGKDFVTIDFNHELAGKTLIFDIEVVSINKP